MLLWLKANDGAGIISDGFQSDFQWDDKSQAHNISQEAYKQSHTNIELQNSAINFNPAVKFDGTAGQFLTGTVKNYNGFSVKSTLFTVTDPIPASSKSFPQGIFSTNDNAEVGQGLFFNKPSGTPFYVMGGADLTGTHSLTNSGSANIDYPILLRGIYPDSVTTLNTEFWDNGVSLLGKKTTGSVNNYPNITPHFDVGGSSVSVGTGNVFDGKIAEIIYFHDTLSVNEADKVESYLAIKYGISLTKDYLASDGIIKAFDYDGNPTFRDHIAGIGRDNGYALDQRVSQNTSPSDIVSVAHNPTAYVTDQNLAASITADKSYLIWSSNDSAKIFGNPVTIQGHNLRFLKRGWRANITGTVGNVSIQFDTAGINIPAGWGSKPALVVTTASHFNASLTFFQAAPGYPNPTFHNVNLNTSPPEKKHFTLVLTKAAKAEVGSEHQSACSNSAGYEFTLDGNQPASDEGGIWEVVTEPELNTVIISTPALYNSKVRLTLPGTALLRWIVRNKLSGDADTAYVEITRNELPEIPYDMTMPAVCPGASNDSIVVNSSKINYRYDVYTAATGGTKIATATGTGDKITIKPGKKITESTYYYIEITNVSNDCVAPFRWKVYIPVYADVVHPDIRIKVCPNPAYNLNLKQYLNAADITGSSFTYPSNPSLISDNTINTAGMATATYTINYSATGHCSSSKAKLYITALGNNQVPPDPKQVKICWQVDLARHVQLQQILGLNVSDGSWEFDSTLGVSSMPPNNSYITTSVDGAYMFNAQKAWLDGKGTDVDGDKYFTFKYYINNSKCIPNRIYTLTVIVTPNL
jgi:hypothetical protein